MLNIAYFTKYNKKTWIERKSNKRFNKS